MSEYALGIVTALVLVGLAVGGWRYVVGSRLDDDFKSDGPISGGSGGDSSGGRRPDDKKA